MIWSDIYWISRLTPIKIFAGVMLGVSALFLLVLIISNVYGYNEFDIEHPKDKGDFIVRKITIIAVILFFASLLVVIFVPSTSEMLQVAINLKTLNLEQ